jgi:hypothetical protein
MQTLAVLVLGRPTQKLGFVGVPFPVPGYRLCLTVIVIIAQCHYRYHIETYWIPQRWDPFQDYTPDQYLTPSPYFLLWLSFYPTSIWKPY